jgi:hypothetical protein
MERHWSSRSEPWICHHSCAASAPRRLQGVGSIWAGCRGHARHEHPTVHRAFIARSPEATGVHLARPGHLFRRCPPLSSDQGLHGRYQGFGSPRVHPGPSPLVDAPYSLLRERLQWSCAKAGSACALPAAGRQREHRQAGMPAHGSASVFLSKAWQAPEPWAQVRILPRALLFRRRDQGGHPAHGSFAV